MSTDNDMMILVRWTGPYSFEEACELKGPGLYLCWGQRRIGRPANNARLTYCGVSEDRRGVGARVRAHEGKDLAHPDNDWWVGRVALPHDVSRAHLEAAEWMVTYFVQSLYNDKKSKTPPKSHVYMVNEWFDHDEERRRRLSGVCEFIADVIGWDPVLQHVSVGDRLRIVDASGR